MSDGFDHAAIYADCLADAARRGEEYYNPGPARDRFIAREAELKYLQMVTPPRRSDREILEAIERKLEILTGR